MYHLFDFEFNDLDNSYEENVTNNNNFEYNYEARCDKYDRSELEKVKVIV